MLVRPGTILSSDRKQDQEKSSDKYFDKPPTADQIQGYQKQGMTLDPQVINPEPGMSIGWKDEMKGFVTSAQAAMDANMEIA